MIGGTQGRILYLLYVQIVGAFRCLPSKQGGFTSGSFRSVVLANNVVCAARDGGDAEAHATPQDLARIKKVPRHNVWHIVVHFSHLLSETFLFSRDFAIAALGL